MSGGVIITIIAFVVGVFCGVLLVGFCKGFNPIAESSRLDRECAPNGHGASKPETGLTRKNREHG